MSASSTNDPLQKRQEECRPQRTKHTYGRRKGLPSLIALDFFQSLQDVRPRCGTAAPSKSHRSQSNRSSDLQSSPHPLSRSNDGPLDTGKRYRSSLGRRKKLFEWPGTIIDTQSIPTSSPHSISSNKNSGVENPPPLVFQTSTLGDRRASPSSRESMLCNIEGRTKTPDECRRVLRRRQPMNGGMDLRERQMNLRPRKPMTDALLLLGDGYEAQELLISHKSPLHMTTVSKRRRTPLSKIPPLQLVVSWPSEGIVYAIKDPMGSQPLEAHFTACNDFGHVLPPSHNDLEASERFVNLYSPFSVCSPPASSMYLADVSSLE